jgi:3'(2'), 5'-bisphosphate nucleotidase
VSLAISASLLDAIIQLSRDAGDRILDIYGSDFAVTRKDDDSPLTQADLASHKTIAAGLAKLTPDIPVLSEEGADTPYATRSTWSQYWLVDPLDGTKEFIKRTGS